MLGVVVSPSFYEQLLCQNINADHCLDRRWATLFGSRATLEPKIGFSSPFYKQEHFKKHFSMYYQPKFLIRKLEKFLAGHIKVLGGLHMARGPDVAQAWTSSLNLCVTPCCVYL